MVLNVHAPSEEKSDNLKDSFHEECTCTKTFNSTLGPLLMGKLATRLVTY